MYLLKTNLPKHSYSSINYIKRRNTFNNVRIPLRPRMNINRPNHNVIIRRNIDIVPVLQSGFIYTSTTTFILGLIAYRYYEKNIKTLLNPFDKISFIHNKITTEITRIKNMFKQK